MGKPVTGYLANDGSFHETEAEADFRDAEEEIRFYCVSHIPNPIDDNALLEYVEALADPISRYLNAKDRIDVEVTRKEVTSKGLAFQSLSEDEQRALTNHFATIPNAEVHSANNTPTEEDLTSLLEQPTDRHEPMPDLGSGASSEGVLDERPSDGIRSGVGHARSLRRRQALATEDSDGTA